MAAPAKSNCNVLCYCRSDTSTGRHPRTPKLAWTPSRLLLLHFTNNKPAEKFDEIIAKLREKAEQEKVERENVEQGKETLVVPGQETVRKPSGIVRKCSRRRRKSRASQEGVFVPEPVVVDFSQPRVRSRLERLMGTNVVRITDRNYMQKLQIRIREDHEENVRKRIHDREVGEVEREKHLILEGKMAVEEAPEELANHPVFKITQMTNKILEEKRQEAEAKSMNQLMKKLQNYELSLPESKDEKEEKESERSIELDEAEIERARRLREIEETMSAGALFTQEDYDRIKYESPLVKQLRSVEDVDELYRLADQIVGPLKAKKR